MRSVRMEKRHSDVYLDQIKLGDVLVAYDEDHVRVIIFAVRKVWNAFYGTELVLSNHSLGALVIDNALVELKLCEDIDEAFSWVDPPSPQMPAGIGIPEPATIKSPPSPGPVVYERSVCAKHTVVPDVARTICAFSGCIERAGGPELDLLYCPKHTVIPEKFRKKTSLPVCCEEGCGKIALSTLDGKAYCSEHV